MPTPSQKVLRVVPFTVKSSFRNCPKQYYFHIKAGNSEIVCQSESYTSKVARDKAMRLLASAKIVIAK